MGECRLPGVGTSGGGTSAAGGGSGGGTGGGVGGGDADAGSVDGGGAGSSDGGESDAGVSDAGTNCPIIASLLLQSFPSETSGHSVVEVKGWPTPSCVVPRSGAPGYSTAWVTEQFTDTGSSGTILGTATQGFIDFLITQQPLLPGAIATISLNTGVPATSLVPLHLVNTTSQVSLSALAPGLTVVASFPPDAGPGAFIRISGLQSTLSTYVDTSLRSGVTATLTLANGSISYEARFLLRTGAAPMVSHIGMRRQ